MIRKCVTLLISCALAVAFVATGVDAQPPSPPVQDPKALATGVADGLVASRAAVLHAGPDDAFIRREVISSTRGLQYVPYDRTYKGLPVVGGDFVVVIDATGRVLSTSVAQTSAIDLASTTPTVTAATAESTARQQMTTVFGVSGTRPVVFALGPPRLAWESTVVGRHAGAPSKLTVLVDAADGTVLQIREHVVTGNGTGAWNGPNPVPLNTSQSGGTYSMADPSMTNVSCQDSANNTVFSGPDDTWGDGDPANRETGCVDALFAAQTLARMLSQWLGRNGFDGNGGGWPIRVGLDQLNAFFDGTQIQIGRNTANQWISSMDVVGHEHGHGIDFHTPGGLSAGGTREFIADVFGAANEWFANQQAPFDEPDFLIGEKVSLFGTGPIRNMYDPLATGDPSCYSDSIPTIGVHKASGPGNHWFYLLAMGSNPANGQPASPTCNNTAVTGLGIQTAVQILYTAMLMKTSNSSYPAYRTWTLTAAKNLFPNGCTEFNTVKAAWDAVSVPPQSGDPTCG